MLACNKRKTLTILLTLSATYVFAAPDIRELELRTGMTSISDTNLATVNALGIEEDSQYLIDLANNSGPDELGGQNLLMVALQAALPGLNFIGDYLITGVHYTNPDAPRSVINDDGSITLILPDRIDEVAYRNMKVNPTDLYTMGDLLFKNITLEPESSVTLIPRPDGQ